MLLGKLVIVYLILMGDSQQSGAYVYPGMTMGIVRWAVYQMCHLVQGRFYQTVPDDSVLRIIHIFQMQGTVLILAITALVSRWMVAR